MQDRVGTVPTESGGDGGHVVERPGLVVDQHHAREDHVGGGVFRDRVGVEPTADRRDLDDPEPFLSEFRERHLHRGVFARRRENRLPFEAGLGVRPPEEGEVVRLGSARGEEDRSPRRVADGFRDGFPRVGEHLFGVLSHPVKRGRIAVLLARDRQVGFQRLFRDPGGRAVVKVEFVSHRRPHLKRNAESTDEKSSSCDAKSASAWSAFSPTAESVIV